MVDCVRIGDICKKVCSGGTPSSSNSAYYEGGTIPWLNTNEVNFCRIYSTEKKITELGYEKSAAKYIDENSVIVAMYGVTAGKSAIAKIKLTTNQACCNLSIDSSKADYEYVYYYLKLQSDTLNKLANGGAQQNLNSQLIKNFKIPLPPLATQKKIASILSAYDSQIENNQKRIKLLEQMAENLYKEWFVRFRFPGYETVGYKSSALGTIPESFIVESMGNIIDYYIGGGWGQDTQSDEYPQDAYVIRGADFPRVQVGDVTSCPHRYHKTSNYKARQLKPLDIILEISGGTQEQPVGRTVIVTENLLNRLGNKVICASFCKQIRLDKKKVLPFYYYYWMQFMYDTRMIDKFQLQSTGIINFKFEYFLRKGLIVLPPMSLMKQFSALIEPLFEEKDMLSEQITHLTTQRDLLLPRLMSGKLSI